MSKMILKILFKILKIVFTVLAIVALVLLISQRLTNNKLRLFGFGVYTVISESMLPEYEIGDMFLAKEIQEEDIKIGDDLVYIGEVDSYKDKVITHRVIRIEPDKTIVTKGINNDLEDPPIQYKQVYGKVASRFVLLSIFSKLMNNNVLFYILIFVPFTLLIFFDAKDLFDEKKKEKKNNEENKSNDNNITTQETTPIQDANIVNETKPVQETTTVVQQNNEVKEEVIENKE